MQDSLTRLSLPALIMLLAIGCPALAAKIIYVDDDAAPGGDGSSWANAYKYLQDALADANSASKPVEFRVAQGTYRPDEDVLNPDGTGDREASFQLINGVTLKGGYAGLGEPDPNTRDIGLYETTLSGDLEGNDVIVKDPCDLVTEATRADNSYRLVKGIDTDSTAVIVGFTIRGGNAYETGYNRNGGGIYLGESNSIVSECTFIDNSAYQGGGLFSVHSSPNVAQCTFSGNHAWRDGGGLWHEYGSPIVNSCKFIGNVARDDAGGVYFSQEGSPTLEYCTITENVAGDDGGGIYCSKECRLLMVGNVITGNVALNGGGIGCKKIGRPKIVDNTITANRAIDDGGGMYLRDSACDVRGNVIRENSAGDDGGGMFLKTDWYHYQWEVADSNLVGNVIVANIALDNGGAIYCQNVSPNISNCLIALNFADDGAGIWCRTYTEAPEYEVESAPAISNVTVIGNAAMEVGGGICCRWGSSPAIADSIIWGNAAASWPQIAVLDDAQLVVASSDVEGNWPGPGNIDADPCFAEEGYRDNNGTPLDPNDDTYTEGDYHLKSQAGRWDVNEGRWVIDDVTSPCIDGGNPMSPIGFEVFPNGGVVNMGAYGGTGEASKSYFGGPPCETIVAGDINGDCEVNFLDFQLMALHWMEER